MRLLTTGANGQVGFELARLNGNNRGTVTALDRAALDITDGKAVRAAVADLRPDAVINAAAYTGVDRAEQETDTAIQVNRDGPANLAHACADADIPLLHISTDYVFDGTKAGPYTEADPAAPLGAYGLSKWMGEEAIREATDKHVIVRVSWVFGGHGNNFVKTMLRVGSERSELRVVADQRGAPTPAADIAAALVAIARRVVADPSGFVWGTYHFRGDPITTWHGFAEAIFAEARAKGMIDHPVEVHPITTAEYPTPARRPTNSALDCTRWQATFDVPLPDWRAGLRHVIQGLATCTDR